MTTPAIGPAESEARASDLWPFNRSTNIIDRDLARSIRTWALTDRGMSEAELRKPSYARLQRSH
jgi:hypothetical protein